jgi:hypothetical protein
VENLAILANSNPKNINFNPNESKFDFIKIKIKFFIDDYKEYIRTL